MSEKELATVNVDEGFLGKFDASFKMQYGNDSVYILTLSDYFTIALARLLEANDLLTSWDSVALFSTEAAVKTLSEYFNKVEGAKENILQEIFGNAPIGSTEKMINENLGPGSFKRMCEELSN